MCLASRYSSRPGRAELAADAGPLEAAPLGLRHVDVVGVDPDRPVAEAGRDAFGALGIRCPDRAGEAVRGVIPDGDGLVLGHEALDRQHRPEDLILGDAHRARHVGEDGRTVVEAGLQLGLVRPAATGDQPGTVRDRARDVCLDLGPVLGRDERPGLGRVVRSVAQPYPLRAGSHLRDEPVVDRVLDDGPRPRRADLAGVGEGRGQGVVHDGLEVGVVEDDVGALAAHLERDLLEVDCRASEQRPARVMAAGQRDEVHVGAVRQRLADPFAWSEHEVDDAGRDAGLVEEPGQGDGRERRHLGGLHDHGVARSQRGRDLPAHLEERVVPRPDQTAHANGLVDDPAERVRVTAVDEAARVLSGEVGVVAEDTRDVGHVPAALAHRLARVERLEPGHRLEIAIDEPGDAVEQRSAFVRRSVRPIGRVERAARGRDRGLDLGVGGDVDLGDDGRVRWVDDRGAGPVRGRDPSTVDVQAGHGSPRSQTAAPRQVGSGGGGCGAAKDVVKSRSRGSGRTLCQMHIWRALVRPRTDVAAAPRSHRRSVGDK